MAEGIIAAALASHSPRMAGQAPPFLAALQDSARAMGARVRNTAPDALVVQSAHWLTTFHWYVAAQARHEGVCVASEAPDLIAGLAYRRPGDPALAAAIAEEAAAALAGNGARCGRNETPHFVWDYGSLVPLLHMDPEQRIPVVLLSTCMAATLDECQAVGAALARAASRCGRRVLFVASGALSHALTRNPQDWPLPARQALDHRFAALLCEGRFDEAAAWLPEFAREGVVEVGGRHLATLLGLLRAPGGGSWRGEVLGYGPSSGSGNANVLLQPASR